MADNETGRWLNGLMGARVDRMAARQVERQSNPDIPKQCPECRADISMDGQYAREYACMTVVNKGSGGVAQSPSCRINQLEASNAKLLAACKKAEWGAHDECPVCYRMAQYGHEPTCILAAALK